MLRQRRERLERGFAHLLGTGELPRVHVCGQNEIRKRMLIQAAAFNLGFLMRKRFGFGTSWALQGLEAAQAALAGQVGTALAHILRHFRRHIGPFRPIPGSTKPENPRMAQTRYRPGTAPPPSAGARGTHLFHGLLEILGSKPTAVTGDGREVSAGFREAPEGVRLQEQHALLISRLRDPVRSRPPSPTLPVAGHQPDRHILPHGRSRNGHVVTSDANRSLSAQRQAPVRIQAPPGRPRRARSARLSHLFAGRRGGGVPAPPDRDRVVGDARRAHGPPLAGAGRCRAAALRRAARDRDDTAGRSGGRRHAVHAGPGGESPRARRVHGERDSEHGDRADPVHPGGLHAHPPDPDRSLPRRGAGRQPLPHAGRPVRGRPRAARRGVGVGGSGRRRPISSASSGCGRRREIRMSAGSPTKGRRTRWSRRSAATRTRRTRTTTSCASTCERGRCACWGPRCPSRRSRTPRATRSRGTTSSPSTGGGWWARRGWTPGRGADIRARLMAAIEDPGFREYMERAALEYATMEDAEAFGAWMAEEVTASRDLLQGLGILDE